eukprot:scaffold225569_cov32-Tisochrysis_lutea.AAC.4
MESMPQAATFAWALHHASVSLMGHKKTPRFSHPETWAKRVRMILHWETARLALRNLLEDLRIHVAEDTFAISNKELATPLGRRLKAHERSRLCRLLEGRLIVQANVVLRQRVLVHLLVQTIRLKEEGAPSL